MCAIARREPAQLSCLRTRACITARRRYTPDSNMDVFRMAGRSTVDVMNRCRVCTVRVVMSLGIIGVQFATRQCTVTVRRTER